MDTTTNATEDGARFEYVIGLDVADDEGYARYRAGMTPLLHEHGGAFRYDFRVGEVLKSETPEPVNRLFVIGFPSREVADRFFADPAYREIRAAHFEAAVRSTTWIADYTSTPDTPTPGTTTPDETAPAR